MATGDLKKNSNLSILFFNNRLNMLINHINNICKWAINFLIKHISSLLMTYMAAILLFSVIPAFENGVNSGMRTHIIVYSLLSFLTALYLKLQGREMPLLKGAVFAGTFGLLMELVQFFIPYRMFEIDDIAINYLSALVAVFPGFFIMRIFNQKS